jgi:hypothetical protein
MRRPHPPMARCLPLDTRSLRSRHEPPPHDVQICQPAADMQPVGILRQSAIADFGPAEDPLDHQERMFNLRPDLRLRTIPGPLLLTQWPMPMRVRLNETLGLGCVLPDHVTLPTLRRVAPHPRFLTMQQLR